MKTALFTFIVDRSSNGRTPAAGRRSQFAVRRPPRIQMPLRGNKFRITTSPRVTLGS